VCSALVLHTGGRDTTQQDGRQHQCCRQAWKGAPFLRQLEREVRWQGTLFNIQTYKASAASAPKAGVNNQART
jgi:hypothetical protein